MRTQIIKLKKRHSTKNERRFMESLKRNHIPFRYKVNVEGREIDFIIGKYAIEIDGHKQDGSKNEMLAKNGYIPVHINNNEIKDYGFNKFSKWNSSISSNRSKLT